MEPTVMLADAQATRALGSRLAQQWLALPPPNRPLLLLQGDLGAGKTCLVQGLAAALGIDEPITSPTFALAQHYQGENGALVHLDLYRLEQSAAADDLLAQEEESALELGALLAVEWPERLSLLPQPRWLLQLTLLDPQNPEAGRRADLSLQP
jgi:tRNA threonylcarbamoyladenosine biosynthesis protein TsaE